MERVPIFNQTVGNFSNFIQGAILSTIEFKENDVSIPRSAADVSQTLMYLALLKTLGGMLGDREFERFIKILKKDEADCTENDKKFRDGKFNSIKAVIIAIQRCEEHINGTLHVAIDEDYEVFKNAIITHLEECFTDTHSPIITTLLNSLKGVHIAIPEHLDWAEECCDHTVAITAPHVADGSHPTEVTAAHPHVEVGLTFSQIARANVRPSIGSTTPPVVEQVLASPAVKTTTESEIPAFVLAEYPPELRGHIRGILLLQAKAFASRGARQPPCFHKGCSEKFPCLGMHAGEMAAKKATEEMKNDDGTSDKAYVGLIHPCIHGSKCRYGYDEEGHVSFAGGCEFYHHPLLNDVGLWEFRTMVETARIIVDNCMTRMSKNEETGKIEKMGVTAQMSLVHLATHAHIDQCIEAAIEVVGQEKYNSITPLKFTWNTFFQEK